MLKTFSLLCLAALAAGSPLTPAAPSDAHACTASPSIWCSSAEIAQACGVSSQCDAYEAKYKDKPVKVTLLYESRCPYCYQFMNKALTPFYDEHQGSLADIELVPYGNARRGASGEITCQHGSRECAFNKMETCSLDHMPSSMKLGYKMIVCLEDAAMSSSSTDTPEVATQKCATKLAVPDHDLQIILSCYGSEKGNELQQAAADFTDAIWPEKHQWVPWIMFNEVSTTKLQDDLYSLLKVVCEWYVSDKPPAACKQADDAQQAANMNKSYKLPVEL